jgi:hypothetical protein
VCKLPEVCHNTADNLAAAVVFDLNAFSVLPGFKAGVFNLFLFCAMKPFESLVEPADPFSEKYI